MIIKVDGTIYGKVQQAGFATKPSDTPQSTRRFPPELGEHTNAILNGPRSALAEIERLHEKGVIR